MSIQILARKSATMLSFHFQFENTLINMFFENNHQNNRSLNLTLFITVNKQKAISFGGSNIDPTAWKDNKCRGESRFPAQVHRQIYPYTHQKIFTDFQIFERCTVNGMIPISRFGFESRRYTNH